MNGIEDDACLGQLFFYSLKKFKENILLYDDNTNEAITFLDILFQSIRTALTLKKKGITRNDVIGTCTYNHKYSCLPLIASQYVGAICANLDPSLSQNDIAHLLKIAEPKILFVSEETLEFIIGCLNEACINTELVVFGSSNKYSQFSEYLQIDEDEKHFKPENVDENETAMILFSSGTTDFPKGICLSHKCLRKGGINFLPFKLTDKNPPVSLTFATFYWITSHMNFINCIVNGYATVLCKKFEPAKFWKLIQKYKVTFTILTTYNVFATIKEKPESTDCSSLEVLMTGGYSASKNIMNSLRKGFPHTRIINNYGQTEVGGWTSSFDPSKEEEYILQLKKPVSCGKIKNSTKWKIVDLISEKKLGPNQEGELRIKSISPMNGYYKMDSSSAFDSEGYFKTGDIAYYDEDECMYVVDRVKEMFKYKVWHILPTAIEEVLLSHPAVKEAAVIGIPHEEDRTHPMGVIVLNDDYAHIDTIEILNYANKRVAEYQKLRAGLRILKYLHRTTTGKLRRRDVKKLILEEIKLEENRVNSLCYNGN